MNCDLKRLGILLVGGLCVVLCVCCERDSASGSNQWGRLIFSMNGLPKPSAAGEAVGSVLTEVAPVDTHLFLLEVCAMGEEQQPVYQGYYGDRPAQLTVAPGAYRVDVRSQEFVQPVFDQPLYGDQQVVVVPAGQTLGVKLWAHHLSAGLRLRFTTNFYSVYEGWKVRLESQQGALDYGLRETRVAYFSPGSLRLTLTDGTQNISLGNRTLLEGQVLTLTLSTTQLDEPSESGFSLVVDTSKVWMEDELDLGTLHDGSSATSAYTVTELVDHVGAEDVWVTGFVVGGDLTTSSVNFDPPFEKMTNLVLAASPSVRERELCVSVELKAGRVRESLNLVEHPQLYGRQLWIRGDVVEAYYGLLGVKSISEWIYE